MADSGGNGGAATLKKLPTPNAKAAEGSTSKGSSQSPATGKFSKEAASLSTRLGEMILTEKEQEGLIFEEPAAEEIHVVRWSVVGKVCSPHPLNIHALERTTQRAWGLHREAQLNDIGSNIFVVWFGSEGDWKHVLSNIFHSKTPPLGGIT